MLLKLKCNLFFEIKGDDTHKLEHLDIIMFPVGES